ncbi:U32 family peptidase [Chloroflexi bacterium TSY]|nr:U32 family peptidase [Chloroflexi bacterium TSY]
MRFNTFVASSTDVELCVEAPNLREVLIEPALLARQGKLSPTQTLELARLASNLGLRPVLVWDALMPETTMNTTCSELLQWDLTPFSVIRVCDPGVGWWIAENMPCMPLHLICETGNHNLEALQGWCEIFGQQLERLILSVELPEAKLMEYCQALPVECEVLGAGSIPLFYSPRSLLAQHFSPEEASIQGNGEPSFIFATVSSDDATHRSLPTLETSHGTFLFLDKDRFILDKLSGLEQAGLHTVRLDLRQMNSLESESTGDVAAEIVKICRNALTNPELLRTRWPRKTHAPFFKSNRTDAQFKKMKSKITQFRDETCLAEIIAGERGKYVLFSALKPFMSQTAKTVLMPTGERFALPETISFRSTNGEPIDSVDTDQLLITDWFRKAVPGSLILKSG